MPPHVNKKNSCRTNPILVFGHASLYLPILPINVLKKHFWSINNQKFDENNFWYEIKMILWNCVELMQYEGNILNSKGVTSSLYTGWNNLSTINSIKLVSNKAITACLNQNLTTWKLFGVLRERERERDLH